MATRFVFKFFGSLGPAGALVGLTEKVCTAIYPHAYNFGDPSQMESQIDKDLRDLRSQYVNELFQIKNKFAKLTAEGKKEDEKKEAYDKLLAIVKSYISKTVRLEKNKYMRERIFFQREGQITLYNEANSKYHNAETEVTDNLVKMAKTICKPSKEEFDQYFAEFNLEEEDQNIKEKISETMAREYLDIYTKFDYKLNTEINRLKKMKDNSDISEEDQAKMNQLLPLDNDKVAFEEYVKDQLFVETGEDVEDIMLAWKMYNLR